MKKLKISKHPGFKVILSHRNLQAAEMTLKEGASTGGPGNKHADSDQWLFVVEGNGEAIVAGKSVKIKKGDLLLIEANETHEIINSDKNDLVTLNFYSPPEY